MQGNHVAPGERVVEPGIDDAERAGLAIIQIGVDDQDAAAEWNEQADNRPTDIAGADDADCPRAKQSLRHGGADVEPFAAAPQRVMQPMNAAHGKQRFGDDELGNRSGDLRGGMADAKPLVEQARGNERADAARRMGDEGKLRVALASGGIERRRSPSGKAGGGALQQPIDLGSIERRAGRPAHAPKTVQLGDRRIVQHHAAGLFGQKGGDDGSVFTHDSTLSLRRPGA